MIVALFCLEPVEDLPLHSWRCCYGQGFSLDHSTLPIGSSRVPWEPPEQLTRYSVKNLAWYVQLPLSSLGGFLNSLSRSSEARRVARSYSSSLSISSLTNNPV